MNWQRLISFFCAMAVLSFSANGLAKSNDLSIKPTIPSSKVKITAPSPAPPVLVAPTKTKTPTHKPAVSAGTPKPAVPKVSVKQPKPSTPKVSVIKPNLSAPKTLTAPASLPPSIGRMGLPPAHIPKDLGKAVNIRRDLGKTNSISGRMPAGHISPAAGFGSTGGAAGLAKGVGQRDGVGSVKDEFSDLMGPTLRTGAGAHRQGDTWDLVIGNTTYTNVPEKVAQDMMGAADAAREGGPDEEAEIHGLIASTYSEYIEPTTKNKDGKEVKKKDLEVQETSSERTVDEGPTDGTPDIRHINPDTIKGIFAGSPGIRLAPGEESAGEGGDINPGQLGEILSNQTQILTFEGGVPKSISFEDLSEQAQKRIKDGGFSTRSD
jgi:hypothetical protein